MAPIPNLIDSEIADLTQYFEVTGNVAAAWRVFHLARKYDRPIPDAIAVEIDRFAACVSETVEKAIMAETDRSMQITKNLKKTKHGDRSRTIAPPVNFRAKELYEVWRGKFGGNPVGSMQDEWRDYGIAEAVRLLVEDGKKAWDAYDIVADREGVDVGTETIKRIWSRYRDR